MRVTVIDAETFRMLMLGLPRLAEEEWLELISGFERLHNGLAVLYTGTKADSCIIGSSPN